MNTEIQKQIVRLAEHKYPRHNVSHWEKQMKTSYTKGMTDLWGRLDLDDDKFTEALDSYKNNEIMWEEAKQQIINALKIKE